ncbi:MAG: hypothetical protein FJY65_01180 [Calditrichaeota bacterium]|nr:hypothetical protein [Calditrichota bacterium]
MQHNRDNTLKYLEQAADNGDYHLYAAKSAVVFNWLQNDDEFKILAEKSKANHYRKIADIATDPVFVY